MPLRPHKMKPKPTMKTPTLSVSSISSIGTSTSTLSPHLSPRRAFLGPSPPPSPSLPSLIPRHGKKPPKTPLRHLRRLVLATTGLSLLLWLAITRLPAPAQSYSPFQEPEYELVGADSLPDEPSAIAVVNERGKTRWTVSIPSNASFPLRPAQYKEICEQTAEIGRELRRAGGRKEKEKGYYQRDRYFLDVREAQRKGLLPRDEEGDEEGGLPMCEKSLTYVMETGDAGMGNTLLGMWIAYGLALKEGRSFFIDDTRWYAPDSHPHFFLPLQFSHHLY
jgi:hypothetical protein